MPKTSGCGQSVKNISHVSQVVGGGSRNSERGVQFVLKMSTFHAHFRSRAAPAKSE